MNRVITVKGTGSVSVKPDLITISINLESHQYDYEKTMMLATESVKNLQEAIQLVGFNESDLKTTNFDIKTHYEKYYDEDNNYKSKFDGYLCKQGLKLEFDYNTETMAKILTEIVNASTNPQLKIQFSVKNKAAIHEELLINATNNARKKADILTKASNVKIGKLLSIDYNWGELRLYSPTEYLMEDNLIELNIRTPDIQPDSINVSDTVSFVWEIQ